MKQLSLRLPDTPMSKDEFREEMAKRTPRAINTILEVMEDGEAPAHVRMACAALFMSYSYGKPRQEAEIINKGGPKKIVIQHFAEPENLFPPVAPVDD